MDASRARHEIENLIHAYAERMDLADFAGVGALLEGARYGGEGMEPLAGGAEVGRLLAGGIRLYDGSPRTKHVTTNVIVELGPAVDEARARSYFTVLQAVDGPPATIVAGRYHDRFSLFEDRWRFTERIIFMDLVGDLTKHLRFDPRRSA